MSDEDLTDDEFSEDPKFIDDESFSEIQDSKQYIAELQASFNKPKSPYVFSVNEIINHENGLKTTYTVFAQNLVESIRCLGFGFLHKMQTLHFNRKGDLLCGSSAIEDALILQCWPNLKWNFEINLTGKNVSDAYFLKYSGYSDMVVKTSDDKILHANILPMGGVILQQEYKHKLIGHLVVNPQTENEIISVGWKKNIYLKDIRESGTHFINKNSLHKISMLHVAHHPLRPEISVCGENNYAYIFDKRNMRRAKRKLGPNNVTFENFWANTCEYNYLGNEILISYSHRIADVYQNERSSIPGKYLYRYRGHGWNSANFMGLCSEYVVTTHGGFNSKYNDIHFWDKKTEALVNFDFCPSIHQVAVHPKEYVVAYVDEDSRSTLLFCDIAFKKPLTFERMLNRYGPHHFME